IGAGKKGGGERVEGGRDVFSLGCVLYEMASGKQAFVGTSTVGILKAVALVEPPPVRSLNLDVPVTLSDLITQLMAKDPAARPASSVKVVQALETIAAGHSPAALTLHHSVAGKAARPSARRLRPAWLIAGLSGVAALLLLFFFGPLSAIFRGKEKPLRPIFRGVSENQILL